MLPEKLLSELKEESKVKRVLENMNTHTTRDILVLSSNGEFAISFHDKSLHRAGKKAMDYEDGFFSPILPLAVSPNNNYIAVGSRETELSVLINGSRNLVYIFDEAYYEINTLSYGNGVVKDIVFSPDEKTIVLGISPLKDSDERTLQLYDIQSGLVHRTIETNMKPNVTNGIAFSCSGDMIIVWDEGDTVKSRERGIKCYSTISGELVAFLPCTTAPFITLTCGPLGTVAALFDQELILVNSLTGKTLSINLSVIKNRERVTIALRPDEKILALSTGSTILFLSTETGHQLNSLPISAQSIAFSSKGKQLYIIKNEVLKNHFRYGEGNFQEIDTWDIVLVDILLPNPLEWLKTELTIPQASLIAQAYKAKDENKTFTIELNKDCDDYKALMSITNSDMRNFLVRDLGIHCVITEPVTKSV